MTGSQRGVHVLIERLKVVALKAPREAPNLFVLVCITAVAVLLLYAYIVVQGV